MLVVDDCREIFEYIRRALRGRHFEGGVFDYAASGNEARVRLADASRDGKHYGLAFVDFAMPGLNGIQTANALWAIDPGLSVILSSGAHVGNLWDSQSPALKPQQLFMLQKPFLVQELRQICQMITRQRQGGIAQQKRSVLPDTLSSLPNSRLSRIMDQLLSAGGTQQHSFLSIGIDRLSSHFSADRAAGIEACAREVSSLLAGALPAASGRLLEMDLGRFAVLLAGCDEPGAMDVARRLLGVCEATSVKSLLRGGEISLSIGLATFRPGTCPADEVMLAAEAARCCAESSGGGMVRCYSLDDAAVVGMIRERQVVPEIERALHGGCFELWGQYIVPLQTAGTPLPGVELLLRMRDSTHQLLRPDRFLPAAERCGLMTRIDRFVVNEALKVLRSGRLAGSVSHLAVNVSPHLLNDPAGIGWLEGIITAAEGHREQLCIEITESARLHEVGTLSAFMEKWTDRGVRFALDDFGAGFSTFDYLLTLPVFYLKVDGSLIRGCATDPRRLDLLRRIVEIGHCWGKETVAEQIEDIETLNAIRALGFDAAQGFALARPAPIAEVIRPAGATKLDRAGQATAGAVD